MDICTLVFTNITGVTSPPFLLVELLVEFVGNPFKTEIILQHKARFKGDLHAFLFPGALKTVSALALKASTLLAGLMHTKAHVYC